MAYKYAILVGDGMADYPLEELGGKTPLEVAKTPHMDLIAGERIGLVKTIPDGMEAGSDVANLAILGYDPKLYHTGRAPLEAASKGIRLSSKQTAFRMNLVSLAFEENGAIRMLSHSGGDIGQKEALELLETLRANLSKDGIEIYPGVAYRHILIWDEAPHDLPNIPPHDHLGEDIRPFLEDKGSSHLWDMVKCSWRLLKEHPVNQRRKAQGLLPANSIWLWGQGNSPSLSSFEALFGLKGATISAVDLIKGIGAILGLSVIEIPGATGYLDSNFKGKAEALISALRELDFVFLHVEAPDEAGHAGDLDAKIKAIEIFDQEVVGRVLEGLKAFEQYKVMVISDHLTPIGRRTHTPDPTPFAWASKEGLFKGSPGAFSESRAKASGLYFPKGHELIRSFLGIPSNG